MRYAKSYRYRVYPTPEQETLLRKTMGCVRLVYNRALATRTQAWHERKERIDYIKTSALLTAWKKQENLQFLNEVSCVPLQQGLRHLQKAFTNFWADRADYPKFKKKHNGGSCEFTKSAFKWKEGQVWLAKCTDALPIRWSRQLPTGCEPSTITVKLDANGRFHICLFVEENINPLPETDKSVGLGVSIPSLITTSNGDKIVNFKRFNGLKSKLKRTQKSLSRKQNGSSNQQKQRQELTKVHRQITDSRKDFLHKLTTQLVRENQTIVVENLAIEHILKNHKLALSISDLLWGELIRQLGYKCQWYGRKLIKVDRWLPSSKKCGSCGHVVDKMPLKVREWDCPKCGVSHDRDINASRNILAAGLAVSVCGANIRPDGQKSKGQLQKTRKGKKQKPKS